MRNKVRKIKPANGVSYYLHSLLRAALPVLVLVFVRANVLPLAFMVVLLSKWRMLVVRPRHWPASIRSNAVDIIVGLSLTVFMAHTVSGNWQLIWTALYILWLVVLKPLSSVFAVSLQALVGQCLGLSALFIIWDDAPILGYVVAAWVMCYVSARHFFASFDEPYGPLFASFWGYFAAALLWALSHWLLFYGEISQPALIVGVISFGLGGIYYMEQTDRLSRAIRRNIVFTMVAIVVVVLAFSDWGGKTL